MAISIISSTQSYNSGLNLNRIIVDSTNKAKENFSYVFILTNSITSQIIAKVAVKPRPIDGYGQLDFKDILKHLYTNDFNFNVMIMTGYQSNLDKFVRYINIQCEESYVYEWNYTDTTFVSGSETKCIQTPNVTAHTFLVGDSIVVIPNNPNIRPSFRGLYNVKTVPNTYELTVSAPWQSTGLNPGKIRYADNRTLNQNLTNLNTFTLFGSKFEYNKWPSTNISYDYILISGDIGMINKKFLTTFKNGYYIDIQVPILVNLISDDIGSFTLVNEYIDSTGTSTILTKNILGANALINLILPTPNQYEKVNIWLEEYGGGTELTETLSLNIDNRCPVNETHLFFEDSLGSYIPLSFTLGITEDYSVNKETYEIDNTGNGITYDTMTEYGRKDIILENDTEYTLTSKSLLNRNQEDLIKELLSSENIYIVSTTGIERVIITSNNYTLYDKQKSGLRKLQVKIKKSNRNI